MTRIYCDAHDENIDDSGCKSCLIAERLGYSGEDCPFYGKSKLKLDFKSEKDKKDFDEI